MTATHQWERTESGEVDPCAFELDMEGRGHNGPRCTVCGFSFCEHCFPSGWTTHFCPGPPPEGKIWTWIGDGAGHPPATPDGTW